jgi:hypothetical protein
LKTTTTTTMTCELIWHIYIIIHRH